MSSNKQSKISKQFQHLSRIRNHSAFVLFGILLLVLVAIFVSFVASADKGSGLGRISQEDLAKISQIGNSTIASKNQNIAIPNPPTNTKPNITKLAAAKPPQTLPSQPAKVQTTSAATSELISKTTTQSSTAPVTLGTNAANLFQNLGSQAVDHSIEQYTKSSNINSVSGIVSFTIPPQTSSDLLVAYYIDKKLVYYTDKKPYSFVLDTLNLPNKTYRLDVVATDDQNSTLAHYVYIFKTDNNPSTWQKFVKYITTPFRAIFG